MLDPGWPRADVWLAQDRPDPDLLVVGVPSSKASLTPSRADLTPFALRDRMARFSTFHSEWGANLAKVTVRDVGNWPISELDMHTMPEAVTELATELPEASLTLYIGGDNAITRPLVAAMAKDLSKVGVITFDAHHDVRSLVNGPTNGTPIRGLIEEHGLPGANVTQIGIHSFANSAEYRAYCDEAGVRVVTVEHVERDGIRSVVDGVLSILSERCESIYVDVDLDVLDRIFAPACPGAGPGGLTIRQLAEGVRRCARHPKVRAMDFVEVDAEADVDGLTLDSMAHVFLSAVAGYSER
ncbi:MAG: agmatinase family protein [Acidimicrobiia bacterium]